MEQWCGSVKCALVWSFVAPFYFISALAFFDLPFILHMQHKCIMGLAMVERPALFVCVHVVCACSSNICCSYRSIRHRSDVEAICR